MGITQALEVACRDGSILVTATRVQRKGRPAWSIWRSLVGGVGVTSAPAGLSVWLQLKDRRRLPMPGVTYGDALRLIATLGYAADDLPAVPPFIQPHTQLTTPCRGGTLQISHDLVTLEGASSWSLPRTAIAGVSAAPGPDSTTLLISMRNGQIVLVDGVPFERALQAIAILGHVPASLPPLPQVGPPPAQADRRGRMPAPAVSRRQIVATDQRRPVAPPGVGRQSVGPTGGRLVPVLTPRPDLPARQYTNGHVRGPSGTIEKSSGVSIMPGRTGALPGTNGNRESPPRVIPTLSPHEPPVAPPYEPGRLTLEAFLWEEDEEGGFLRRLTERLRMPALPNLPELRRPLWLHLPAEHRRAVPAAEWQRPPGPYEQRPTDWQRSPGAPTLYARPAAWLGPAPRQVSWRRPAWLRLPQVRRHDVPLPQARPTEWQRRPVAAALYARPAEWDRQPEDTRTDARPLEWQRQPSAQRPASRASTWARAVWGSIARPDASAGVALVALVLLLLLLPAFVERSHLSGSVSRASSPAAAQPALKVFAGSQDGAVYVLDARTGALEWRYQTNARVESAPAVADGIVYVGSDDHAIYALRPATRSMVWRYQTGGPVTSALTVAAGVVYAGSYDGALYALRARDGALLWRYQTGSWIAGQPALANGVIFVGSYDDYIYALRANDGKLLWRYQTQGMVASSPVVNGGVVYVGSADDGVYALRASDGKLLWRTATGGSVYSSPSLVNGVVYVGSADNYVYALRSGDGAVLWRTPTGGLVLSSPTLANGVVYVGSFDDSLYALRAADGSVLWRYRTHDAVVAPPTAANGIVYAGSADGSVYALSARSGTLVWSYHTGGRINWRVAVGG